MAKYTHLTLTSVQFDIFHSDSKFTSSFFLIHFCGSHSHSHLHFYWFHGLAWHSPCALRSLINELKWWLFVSTQLCHCIEFFSFLFFFFFVGFFRVNSIANTNYAVQYLWIHAKKNFLVCFVYHFINILLPSSFSIISICPVTLPRFWISIANSNSICHLNCVMMRTHAQTYAKTKKRPYTTILEPGAIYTYV